MPRLDPYNLRMQIGRMYTQGQSMFCTFKVQDWLRERDLDPNDFEIVFHPQPSSSATNNIATVEIELRRKDGQPIDPDLQAEINYFA